MSKADAWKAWEGRTVDSKYSLGQWLGGSDHSAVFATERPDHPSQKAAIKLIDASTLDPQREVARITSASKLSHPHLLSIFTAGHCTIDGAGIVYVVMEYADEDLSQILPQRPLTPVEVSDMLPPVLEGLSYVHSHGFVHSRLRPSNILAAGDQLKLAADQITLAGEPLATRRRVGVFDAPEIATGTISPPADIWSLGVTIITALTQQAIPQAAAPKGDSDVPGNLPEPFSAIVRDCLHIDPQKRSSIADIRARLDGNERSAPSTPVPPRALERDTSRLPAFVIPLVLVLLVLAAWGFFHSRGKQSSEQKPAQTSPTVTQAPSANPAEAKPSPAEASPAAKRARPAAGAVLHQVMPDVSQSARNTIHGTIKVSVQVQVDASGKVSSAKLKSAGPSRYFAERALKAAEQWQFAPEPTDGRPAASSWIVQFRFRRNGTQALPERITR
jgi:TonB family protein